MSCSAHPDRSDIHDLVLARTVPEAKYTRLCNRLTIRPAAGAARRIELTAPELHQALRDLSRLAPQPEWAPLIEAIAGGQRWP